MGGCVNPEKQGAEKSQPLGEATESKASKPTEAK